MAAWQHLVLEEGQDDQLEVRILDMTKCFEQVRLWHVWRWGYHWGFPRALLTVILSGLQFPTACGIVGVGVSSP